MIDKGLKRPDCLAALALFIGLLWFGWELVSTNHIPYFRDLGPFFYPMRFLLAQSFKAGELPLWDRHMAMGFPLLANFQSGALYPPNVAFLLLPFFAAIKAIFLFHYLIALAGTYLLFRHWRYPAYLSVVGAFLFTFGGTIVSLSNLLNHFQTAVWLPWLILSGERALLTPSRKNFLAFVAVSMLQFLAGSPEFYAMSVSLLLLDYLVLTHRSETPNYVKSVSILLGANFLAVCLAMVQVLPTAELFLESRGPKPLSYGVAAAWSLRPVSLLNIFFPYGEADTSMFSATRFFFRNDIPLLVSHYLGAISIFGLGLWCVSGSRREKVFFMTILAASSILAFGDHTPVYRWLYHSIPLFNFFRFPEKFFLMTHALVVLAILRGLYAFVVEDNAPSGRAIAVLSALCGLMTCLYLFVRLDTESVSYFISWITRTPLYFDPMVKSASGALVNLERQTVLGLGVVTLLVLWKKGKFRASLFQTLIVVLVFIDLSSANRPYQYLLDPGFVFNGKKILTAPDASSYRIFYYPTQENLHPNYYVVRKGQSFAQLNTLMTENLLPNTGVFYGFDYMQELDALRRWSYRVFIDVANELPAPRQYHLLRSFNVKYIMALTQPPPGDISLVRYSPDYPSWLYELDGSIPRAYLVSQARYEEDPVRTVEQLSELDFDPKKEVILQRPAQSTGSRDFQSQARILEYANQRVAIHATLNEAGYLVLADYFYPGWRAAVDGKDAEILRANLFFRAVPLTAGEHRVEFQYKPLSFTFGWIISLTTLLGLVFWCLLYDRVRARFRS